MITGTELLPRDARRHALPPDDRRCTATARTGERCTAWRARDGEHCSGHAGLGFTSETGKQAQGRSVQARQRYAYARKLTGTGHTLTADDILRLRLAEEAVTIADTMLAPLTDEKLGSLAKANHAAMLQDRARPDLRPDILAAITLERAKAQLGAPVSPGNVAGLATADLEALAAEWEEVDEHAA
jgi:hypothetical protein